MFAFSMKTGINFIYLSFKYSFYFEFLNHFEIHDNSFNKKNLIYIIFKFYFSS